jgi:uncharacterized protein (UPF0264 family)
MMAATSRRNRKLLVSVFNAQEAREAVLGGGRIIDSEDPKSALGNIKPHQIMAISDAVLNYRRDLDVQLSTNIGEDQLLFDRSETGEAIAKSPYEIEGKASQAAIGVACAMGTRVHPCNLVKVGVDGMRVELVRGVLEEVVRTLNRTEQFCHCQVMAVLFAQDMDAWHERREHPAVRRNLVELREFHPWEEGSPISKDLSFDVREFAIDNLRDGDGKLLFPSEKEHGEHNFGSEEQWREHWRQAVSPTVDFGTTYQAWEDIPVELLGERQVLPEGTGSPIVVLNELFEHGRYFNLKQESPRTTHEVIMAMVDAAAETGADAIMIDTRIQTKVARICFLDTASAGLVDINRFDVGAKGDKLPRQGILSLDDARFFVDYCHYKGIEANIAGSVQSYQAQQLWRLIPELDQVSTRGASSGVEEDPSGAGVGMDTRQHRVIKRTLVQGLAAPEHGGVANFPDFMQDNHEAMAAIEEFARRYPDCEWRFVDAHGRPVSDGPRPGLSPVIPLKQQVQCSLTLEDADLDRGDANWQAGLQAQSDWTWSGNLYPNPFRNNLGRFFLKVPGILERQLHFSTALIFDEPSFRNGVQMSGFVHRPLKEMVISFIAQKRRCWYSMTHHAILGRLTCDRHGVDADTFESKWTALLEYDEAAGKVFSDLERLVLKFADCFTTDPRELTLDDVRALREAFREDNQDRFADLERPMLQREAARVARGRAIVGSQSEEEIAKAAADAAEDVSHTMPADMMDRKINGQLAELGLLCMQFVALTGVFTGLGIPDEDFVPDFMRQLLPDALIEKINELNSHGPKGMAPTVPEAPKIPLDPLVAGEVTVLPVPLRREDDALPVPLQSYELQADADFGMTQGGSSVAAWGWGRGLHFPGGLVHLMNHLPETGRLEADYSLPLIFNDDQTRNGEPTAGFVDRVIKELIIQKAYRLVRCRYGLEHHTLYCYNEHRRKLLGNEGYGAYNPFGGNPPEIQAVADFADQECTDKLLRMHEHEEHPEVYSPLERAVFAWVDALVCTPHSARECEQDVRDALREQNQHEIQIGARILNPRSGQSVEQAMDGLIESQIAEMAMMACHFDGLGRAMTILQLEGEGAVDIILYEGEGEDRRPALNDDGDVQRTGYFNQRPDFLVLLGGAGVDARVMTLNELFCNPQVLEQVRKRIADGEKNFTISADDAAPTAQF